MKIIRENTQANFESMRLKARNAVKSGINKMGPIKGFGELQDSIVKMRENFDYMIYGRGTVVGGQLV